MGIALKLSNYANVKLIQKTLCVFRLSIDHICVILGVANSIKLKLLGYVEGGVDLN